jgi:hypothetical protein
MYVSSKGIRNYKITTVIQSRLQTFTKINANVEEQRIL